MENENAKPTMSFSGWLPNGMKVYFTMPSDYENAMEMAIAFTDKLMAKGFSQQEPGIGKGEHTELIGVVARREKVNKDGSISTVLDLYAAAQHLTFRYMGVYLDTPEDVQAFEKASGLKLENVPLNPADSPPSKDNTRLVMTPKKPLTVVYTNNPDYDETSDAKKPKRLFVRWDGAQGSQPSPTPENAANANVGASEGNSSNPFQYDRIKMFMEVAKVAMDIATPERNNTIIKMESEGAFKGISNYQQGVDLVQARLANHRQKASA